MAAFDESFHNENKVNPQLQTEIAPGEDMWRYALSQPQDNEIHYCLIERNESVSSFFGKRPDAIYSLRHGTNSSNHDTSRIWAQRRVLTAHPFFSVSTVVKDLEKSRDERSKFFLGKVKTDHDGRLFMCLRYNGEDDPYPIACVVYEHDRVQGERKMEVGLPKHSDNISLREKFMKIRYDGLQNVSNSGEVVFFNQKVDDPVIMSSTQGINDFHSSLTLVSTKNFQLVRSVPFRKHSIPTPLKIDSEVEEKDDLILGVNPETGENWIVLELGKIDKNLYSVCYRYPMTPLLAFMIALTRFETSQKY